MCFSGGGGGGGSTYSKIRQGRQSVARRNVASTYQARSTDFQAGSYQKTKSFANHAQAVQDYAPGGKMTQGINTVYAAQQRNNPDMGGYAKGYTVRPGIDYEVVKPDYSGIDKNLSFKKQLQERAKIGNAARKQTEFNMRYAQGKTNAPSGTGGQDYYSARDTSPTNNGGNIKKAENPQVAIDKQRDDWIKSEGLTGVKIRDNGTQKTVTGQKFIGSIEDYNKEFGKEGRSWENDKRFAKTTTKTKYGNQGRVAIQDEASARKATRKLREGVAEDKVTGKKTKKKGGLRIDKATGTNSRGSGVFIPK